MGRRSEHRAPASPRPGAAVDAEDRLEQVVRLVRVQAALVLLVGLVDALTDGVMNTALTSTNALGERVVPSAGLVVVTLTVQLLGAAVVVAAAAVLVRYLRRGRRWARVAVLVLAVARGIGLVAALLATAVYLVSGPSLLVPAPPAWWSTLGAAVSAGLFARMLVDLYGPELSAWFAERRATAVP